MVMKVYAILIVIIVLGCMPREHIARKITTRSDDIEFLKGYFRSSNKKISIPYRKEPYRLKYTLLPSHKVIEFEKGGNKVLTKTPNINSLCPKR
jgi:hypothetical protein